VLIVHDHPIRRRGLALSLGERPDVEIVGEAATSEEAIQLLEQVPRDVIFLDVVLLGLGGGVRAIRLIHDAAPDVKIMVVSTFAEGDRVQEALHAGASAYVLNDIAVDQLLDAIRQVVSGVASPGGGAIARSDD
jgi:DNA-binding NarL/FixJ family response regulator